MSPLTPREMVKRLSFENKAENEAPPVTTPRGINLLTPRELKKRLSFERKSSSATDTTAGEPKESKVRSLLRKVSFNRDKKPKKLSADESEAPELKPQFSIKMPVGSDIGMPQDDSGSQSSRDVEALITTLIETEPVTALPADDDDEMDAIANSMAKAGAAAFFSSMESPREAKPTAAAPAEPEPVAAAVEAPAPEAPEAVEPEAVQAEAVEAEAVEAEAVEVEAVEQATLLSPISAQAKIGEHVSVYMQSELIGAEVARFVIASAVKLVEEEAEEEALAELLAAAMAEDALNSAMAEQVEQHEVRLLEQVEQQEEAKVEAKEEAKAKVEVEQEAVKPEEEEVKQAAAPAINLNAELVEVMDDDVLLSPGNVILSPSKIGLQRSGSENSVLSTFECAAPAPTPAPVQGDVCSALRACFAPPSAVSCN